MRVLDARAFRRAVISSEPNAVVHGATALANVRFSKNLDRTFAQTNRLRTWRQGFAAVYSAELAAEQLAT